MKHIRMRYFRVITAIVMGLLSCVQYSYSQESTDERVRRMEAQVAELSAQNAALMELITKMSSGQQLGVPIQTAPAYPPPAANYAPTSGFTADASTQFTPGWVARIYDLPTGFDFVSTLPPTVLGYFDMDKNGYALSEASENIGIPLTGNFLWRGEGFLLIRDNDSGPYTFALSTDGGRCSAMGSRIWAAVYVEDQKVLERADFCGQETVIGGVNLLPGLHRVEMRFVAGIDRNVRAGKKYNPKVRFDLSVKGPSDSKPRPGLDYILRRVH